MLKRKAFTLIELLIVIGLLGALAAMFLTQMGGKKDEMIDNSVVQKELADIQRAFFRLHADCVLQSGGDYDKIVRYGLAVLMQNSRNVQNDDPKWLFSGWDDDRGRGWRGPYITAEGYRAINDNSVGQDVGSVTIPVICTPNGEPDNTADPHYYRVLATDDDDKIITPPTNTNTDYTNDITQFWVVYPCYSETPTNIDEIPEKYRRRLLMAD